MAYRYGNRYQLDLFPQSIEDYVNTDDPVRAYDAFVEALNIRELGIALDEDRVGNPEYNPKSMVKLLLYGYSYGGLRSSRKLERAAYHNISFIWLMGGLKPDHKTIANFRKDNKHALKKILKQCARLCIKLDLIEGNALFADGSKIRANASIKNTWTVEKCNDYLKHIDKTIDNVLSECDTVDQKEQDQQSLVKMKETMKEKETLKSEVQNILRELKDEEKKSLNTVDPDCTRINSTKGSHAGYNAQLVVDEKHGLIVQSDAVSTNSDYRQFAEQINKANDTLEKKCDTACADSGYADTTDLEKIDKQKIKVIVPSRRQASKKKPRALGKEHFSYDSENDCYACPEGHQLPNSHFCRHNKHKIYSMSKPSLCRKCRHFGVCTKSKRGRVIARLMNEEVRLKLEAQYKDPNSQDIYKLRQQKVELPFGHIKRNLNVRSFLLRGLDGAKTEMSLLASCFNISRMITIFGVPALVKQLARS